MTELDRKALDAAANAFSEQRLSDQHLDAAERIVRAYLAATPEFIGKLDQFPDGKLGPHDEGAIQLGVGEMDGKVMIDFGTPVHWLGVSPQEAADLAMLIVARARAVARKNGESLTVTIGG
jgi:hypothetical protein